MLRAAGGGPFAGEIDGLDIIPALQGGDATYLRDRTLYWEMDRQTAIRRGPWKLVIDGQLVEGAPPEDAVHLSDVVADPGERVNLRDARPELTAELSALATRWRAGIDERWAREWLPRASALTGHGGHRVTSWIIRRPLVTTTVAPRPLLRGWLHAGASLLAVVGTILLVGRTWTDTLRAVTMLVFGLSMVELYLVSAIYHIGTWEGRAALGRSGASTTRTSSS